MDNQPVVPPTPTEGSEPTIPVEGKREFSDYEKQLYNQLQVEKGKRAELEGQLSGKKGEPDSSRFDAVEHKVELRIAGYTAEDIKDIEVFAKGAGLNIREASEHPFVKSAIEARRTAAKVEANTPSPSHSSPMIGDKPASQVLSSSSASVADKKAAFEAIKSTVRK